MITVGLWVLLLVALGVAAHLFGVDSRDAAYSCRLAPQPLPGTATRAGAAQAHTQIR